MSDTSEALPQTRTSIGIGTIFRLLAIALGIMSALLIARDGFKVSLSAYVEVVATLYDDALSEIVGVLFEPVVKALFGKLRDWLAIELQLLPHWKHVFVLQWLVLGKLAGVVAAWTELRGLTVFLAVWGGLCALVGAAVSGALPLASLSIFLVPLVSMLLYFVGLRAVLYRLIDRHKLPRPGLLRRRTVTIAIGLAFVTALFASVTPGAKLWMFEGFESPGLAAVVFIVGLTATAMLIVGLVIPHLLPRLFPEIVEGDERVTALKLVGVTVAGFGLDILAVLGGAAFIVWLGHALA